MDPASEGPRPFVLDRISFAAIPGSTRIYLDYLNQESRLSGLYPGDWRDPRLRRELAGLISQRDYPRSILTDVLTQQNRALGDDDAAIRNIERLRDRSTVAVVTGQQAGLFTGPLYTLTKALSAVKWARRLTEEGIPAVPVFWAEIEDHDIGEVDHCGLPDRSGQWKDIHYRPQDLVDGQPISRLILDEGVAHAIAQLLEALPASEFVEQIRHSLSDFHAPGVKWADAFARLLLRLTAGTGLVWMDPSDPGLKPLLAPLYGAVIEQAPKVSAALVSRSRELRELGYHNQLHITPEMVPLFLLEDGRRRTLFQQNGKFQLKGGEQEWTAEELRNSALSAPESFSQAAALRPLAQDTLLPTLIYVGGPAEIAYFAQLQPLYQILGRVQPLLAARASLTVMERRHAKTLERYQLRFLDLFRGPEELLREVAERSVPRELLESFSMTEALVQDRMTDLGRQIAKTDPTLAEAAQTAAAKMIYQISNLRAKLVTAQARREESREQQIRRACAALAPDRQLQERRVNPMYFYARFGPDFLNWLYQAIDLDQANHGVMTLEV